jgi:hypothetical protein
MSVPRALDTSEIPRLVADYVHAAKCAMRAGFDGVEVRDCECCCCCGGGDGLHFAVLMRGSKRRARVELIIVNHTARHTFTPHPTDNRRYAPYDPPPTTTTTNHNDYNYNQHFYLTQRLSLRRCTPPTDTSSTSFSTAAQTSEPMRTAAVCRTAAGFSLKSSRPCAKLSVQAGMDFSNPCARLREHIWFETLSLVWKCVPGIDIRFQIPSSKFVSTGEEHWPHRS